MKKAKKTTTRKKKQKSKTDKIFKAAIVGFKIFKAIKRG